MARREVYATTGTRIRVRVFSGYGFEESDLTRSDFARYGYENGIPMGGGLSADADRRAPRFLVRALRDPDGANLDRIQMIKGWLTADRQTEERVYDISWSDDRVPDKDGRLPPVGNTVDVDNASYTNEIGDVYLTAFWEDQILIVTSPLSTMFACWKSRRRAGPHMMESSSAWTAQATYQQAFRKERIPHRSGTRPSAE